MFALVLAALATSAAAQAHGHLARHAHAHAHAHHDVAARALPGDWFHPRSSPLGALFARQAGGPYPEDCGNGPLPADATTLPARWLTAYLAAQQQGLIPPVPVATPDPAGGNPRYPPASDGSTDGSAPEVCSATVKCRADGDVWDAPPGILGVSFDDGPVAIASTLYPFLKAHDVPSTHFMIGCVIKGDTDLFDEAFNVNQASIAVHTWTHPLMMTLADLAVVAELGWTMQIIADLTGGRVARFWRPPLGNADLRVRAIAKEVFGLTTVLWNNDSEDWRISGGYNGSYVGGNLTTWLEGPKTPGLIILEHELTNDTVQFFINTTYALAVKHGWTLRNIPQLLDAAWYQNAADDAAQVTTSLVGVSGTYSPTTSSSSTSTSTSVAGMVTADADGDTGGAEPATALAGTAAPNATAAGPDTSTSGARPVRAGVLSLLAAFALLLVR